MITKFKIFETNLAGHIPGYIKFGDNEYLPPVIYVSGFQKNIRVQWNHKPEHNHNFYDRIKKFGKVDSVSDFLTLIKKSFDVFIPQIQKKDQNYCLHLTDREIYILIRVWNKKLWLNDPPIYIVSIYPNPPEEKKPPDDYIMIDIDDTFFLI